MLILAEASDTPQQLPQLGRGKLSTGAGDVEPVPRAAVAGARGDSTLPSIRGSQQRHGAAGKQQTLDAEMRQLEEQLRAKDVHAQQLLDALADPQTKQPSQSKQLQDINPATLSAARGTGLQPAELAEAARIGLTPEDLEQLIEDLAAKEFHHLEQMMEQIERQGGSKDEAVDRWAKQEAEKWVKEQFGATKLMADASTAGSGRDASTPPRTVQTDAVQVSNQSATAAVNGRALDEDDQVAMLTLNAYTARRELVKMKQELARLKSQGHNSTETLVKDAVRLRNQAQAQVTGLQASDPSSEALEDPSRDHVRQKQLERELAKVREEAMREAGKKERRALERAERQIRSLMEERNDEQASRTSERVKTERIQREEAARVAKERAEERAHELALRKQELARYKAEMREAAERRNHKDVEDKVRERARRLAREEAERRARDHVSQRTAEIREMRERKAREEAEKKVVLERQAREEAEKKAKVQMNRMAREEAKRKKIERDQKKARELLVQRQFEAEQQRFKIEEDRKMEALKAMEEKQKRQQEKLERKERKLREQAEKQATVERQARKEIEQKMAMLEEDHNAEVAKRKEIEAAYKRKMRQQEDDARQLAMTTRANAELEKQLFTLTSSLGGSDFKAAAEAAGDLSVHLTPQQKHRSVSPTRRLHPTPTARSPSAADGDGFVQVDGRGTKGDSGASTDAVLPEAELLRSSYYVRHLKDLASRELLREAGIQPEEGSELAAKLADKEPIRAPAPAPDANSSGSAQMSPVVAKSDEHLQARTETSADESVNEALADMEASIQKIQTAANSLSDQTTPQIAAVKPRIAAAHATAAAHQQELQRELATLRELVHQVESGHGDFSTPLETRKQRLDALHREMRKSCEMVEKVKAEEEAAAKLAVASPEAVELANDEAQALEEVRNKMAELEALAGNTPTHSSNKPELEPEPEPEPSADHSAAPAQTDPVSTQARQELDGTDGDGDGEGLDVQEKLQRLFKLREELLKSSAYVSHLKKVATRELRDVVHRRQAEGNVAVDEKLEAAAREAAATREVLSSREGGNSVAPAQTRSSLTQRPPHHQTVATEVVDEVISDVMGDIFGPEPEPEPEPVSQSEQRKDTAPVPRYARRMHKKPWQQNAGAHGSASKGRRAASTGAAARAPSARDGRRQRGGTRSLSPTKMASYGQPRSNRYRNVNSNSRLNASSHQRRYAPGAGGKVLPRSRAKGKAAAGGSSGGGGAGRRRSRGDGSTSALPRSLNFTAPIDSGVSHGKGKDVRHATAGPSEFADNSSPGGREQALPHVRSHRGGAGSSRRHSGTRVRRGGAMMDTSASWGSFGGPGDTSPGLRETAKALGLPLPTDGLDEAGLEDTRDAPAPAPAPAPAVVGGVAGADSPQVGGWVDGAEASGPAAVGSDTPPQNWRAEQEAGWAASLPQQSDKDRALAEAYLPPSLLHAYRAKPMPKANRRYVDSNPFS